MKNVQIPKKKTKTEAKSSHTVGNAFIYMAQFGTDHVKIGRTRNIKKRMKNLQTAVPCAVNVIKTWKVDANKASQFETKLKHTFHKNFHQNGGGTEIFEIGKVDYSRAIGMVNRRARAI